MTQYQRIVLASRPQGEVQACNFRLEQCELPELQDGQLLVRNHYLSLDPYMRGRMEDSKSYAAPQPLDQTMIGGTVGEVVASKHPKFAVGARVLGRLGWTEMALTDGSDINLLPASDLPLSVYLGAVGMPGMTAWYGLTQIIAPKAGETVLVSAASGAVGSVVGQLAKRLGCRVVGVAGGAEKCRYVVDQLGFDACVDYKAGSFLADLAAATPDGIDGIFENVGGAVFDAALARINPFGRIALCGMIAGYNGEAIALQNVRNLLTMRVSLRGFIVSEHMDLWPQGLKQLAELVGSGELKFRESIAQGLASAPEAFIGLLKGKNFGKQLVKLI